MSKRLEEIAQRKRALIARCAQERDELSGACDTMRSPLRLSVAIAGISRLLKANPLAAAAISSLFVSGYGGKIARSAVGAAKLWRAAEPLRTCLFSRGKR